MRERSDAEHAALVITVLHTGTPDVLADMLAEPPSKSYSHALAPAKKAVSAAPSWVQVPVLPVPPPVEPAPPPEIPGVRHWPCEHTCPKPHTPHAAPKKPHCCAVVLVTHSLSAVQQPVGQLDASQVFSSPHETLEATKPSTTPVNSHLEEVISRC